MLTLDKLINGFKNGELITIASRPAIGKSSFVISILNKISNKKILYYNLEESIYIELKKGMNNVRNNTYFHNLIFGNLMVKVYFRKSYLNYLIQGADLVAGTVRKYNLLNKEDELTFINYQIYLPTKKGNV